MSNPSKATALSPAVRRGRLRRWAPRAGVGLVVLLVLSEIGLRLIFGLGNPPLLMNDPKMEYRFQPNQDLRRFFNHIHYNQYSMRSDDFPKTKSSPAEFRVLVVGDSVVNGGVQTDQAALATSILQRELSAKLGRPVVIGNASAGSWGPPNQLGWIQTFGLLDADVLVLVESSHDAVDVPTWVSTVGIASDSPDRRPISAIGELLSRYLIPRVRVAIGLPPVSNLPSAEAAPDGSVIEPKKADEALGALRQMIAIARAAQVRVVILQHIEQTEADGALRPGHDLIEKLAESEGVEVVQLRERFIDSRRNGKDPWRDGIHPNEIGQRLIADAMLEALTKVPSTQPGEAAR